MILVSIYIPNPQFQGQTKEKLTNPEAAKYVEQAIKDRFLIIGYRLTLLILKSFSCRFLIGLRSAKDAKANAI
jgi:hypothetical protein